jgi:hypothetical protein
MTGPNLWEDAEPVKTMKRKSIIKIISEFNENNQENPDIMIGITLKLAYSLPDQAHITREYAPARSPTS